MSESTCAVVWMIAIQLVANIVGPLSHFCLTNAYRIGDATGVVPIEFLRIPRIAFIGWRPYGEPIDPFVFMGSASIVAGIRFNMRAEAQASGRA
jgi:drug/metabolite transporter (DMT)-like permease